MTELEFELEFKKRKLQKRKQRRMELLIIGAHLGVVLVLLYWMFGIGMADPCAPLTGMEICFCTRDGSFGSRIMEMWWSSTGRIWNGTL